MTIKDKNNLIRIYNERLKKFGNTPRALGWGNGGKKRQFLRFKILFEIGIQKNDSVLDVGCGFGDFYGFLRSNGWQGEYLGIDINNNILKVAKSRYPDIKVLCVDLLNYKRFKKFDFVIESGIFNEKFEFSSNLDFIEKMLNKMFRISRKGIACNFLSTFVDFEAPGSFHSDPAEIIRIAKKFTNKLILRMDYLKYEFTIYCKK